jgi:hypothetical protein
MTGGIIVKIKPSTPGKPGMDDPGSLLYCGGCLSIARRQIGIAYSYRTSNPH